jgi:purine-binding chemotaxis protein CheW
VACACDLDVVREIVRTRPLARLPGAPTWVIGIMNLRGTLLTVVDLSVRLGGVTEGGPSGVPRVVMVVEGAGKRFGIGVESVQGVADVATDAIEPVDAQRASGGVIGGLVHLGEDGADTAQWCAVEAIARESLAV